MIIETFAVRSLTLLHVNKISLSHKPCQMEDQNVMLTQQSEQLRHLHEEKQIAQQLVEKFQNNIAELEGTVSVRVSGWGVAWFCGGLVVSRGNGEDSVRDCDIFCTCHCSQIWYYIIETL